MVWSRPLYIPEELKSKEFWAYRIDDDGQLSLPIARGFVERVQRCNYEPYNIDFVSYDHQSRKYLMDCVVSDDCDELCSHFVGFAKEQIFLMEAKSRALKLEVLKL